MSVIGNLIVELVTDASEYQRGLDEAEAKTTSWGGRIAGAATTALKGAVVGAATAAAAAVTSVGVAAFDVSMQTEKAAADMAASLNLPIDAARAFAEVARDVYGNNFTDSVQAAGAAVAEVARQFQLAADDPALQSITEKALALEDSFGTGVTESIAAARQLMNDFGLDANEAFDFITAGYQRGLDASGDFLDSVTEYSTQFANGGADAGQFFSVLESGMQAGTLGTDKAADAFKEFRLRIVDGSDTTAQALAMIGLSAEDMTTAIDSGAMTAADAFAIVVAKLGETEQASVRMQAGAGLLGTQFEDLGDSAATALDLTKTSMDDLVGATDALNSKYENFGDRAAAMWRQLTVEVSPLTDKILELAEQAMPHVQQAMQALVPLIIQLADNIAPVVAAIIEWIATFAQLHPTIAQVALAIGVLAPAILGVIAVLGPVIAGITALAGVFSAVAPAVGIATAAIGLLASPIGLVVAAVAALVLAWSQNWFGIRDTTQAAVQAISGAMSGFMSGVGATWESWTASLAQKASTGWDGVQQAYQRSMDGIRNAVTGGLDAIRGAWDAHGGAVRTVVDGQMNVVRAAFDVGMRVSSEAVRAGMAFMRGDWDTGMQHLQNATQTGLEAARGAFQMGMQGMQTILQATNFMGIGQQKFYEIVYAVQGIDWWGVGMAITQGITNGIYAGAGSIVSAAQQAAMNALNAAKAWLGIGSPSRRAAEEIGKPISQGIGVGAMAEMDRVAAQIGFGLDSMLGTLTPASAGMAGGGATIQITQHFGAGVDGMTVKFAAQDGVLAGLRQAGLR